MSRDAWRRFGTALAYDALEKKAEADRALGDPEQLAGEGPYYQLAQFYAHRGEMDRAFAMLERGHANYDPGVLNHVRVDPLLEPLRTEPRYKALVRTISTPRRFDG